MAFSVAALALCLFCASLAVPSFGQVAPFRPANSTTPPPFTPRQGFAATTLYGRTYIYGSVGNVSSTQGLTNEVAQ